MSKPVMRTGRFFVTHEGPLFCLFPVEGRKCAFGALVNEDHTFGSEVLAISASGDFASGFELHWLASDASGLGAEFYHVDGSYEAPVEGRESVFILTDGLEKCASLRFGKDNAQRDIRVGFRPVREGDA